MVDLQKQIDFLTKLCADLTERLSRLEKRLHHLESKDRDSE